MIRYYKVYYSKDNMRDISKYLLKTNVDSIKCLDYISDMLHANTITLSRIDKNDYFFLDKIGYKTLIYEVNLVDVSLIKENASNNVKLIKHILDSYKIYYEVEKTFKGCMDKKLLRFDFYIPIENNKFILMEYNGKQHYEYVPYFHRSYKNYKDSINRDKIKVDFCKSNGINLYKINFNDDVVYRLTSILKENKLI